MPFTKNIPTICAFCGAEFLAEKPASTRPARKYCSLRCAKESLVIPVMEKFWSRFERGEGCWLWTRGKTRAGYGFLSDRGRPVYAHRLSWEVHRGPIPPNMDVCHNCPGGDNPACLNPAHLFLAPHRENIADMDRKGRRDTSGLVRAQPGEAHYAAKLTEADVHAIRARGNERHSAIARDFGVSRPTITAILTRRNWTHI